MAQVGVSPLSKSNVLSRQETKALSREAILYMILLAFQFGLQPILTKRFTPPTVCRSTVIFVQECLKFTMAYLMLYLSGNVREALQGWTVYGWLSIAGLPASLYAVQNLASLMAYQNLDALTYNVLNQTKTLSAALCCYLVMGKRQSNMQILALFILLAAALVMERILTLDALLGRASTSLSVSLDPTHMSHGVIPILLASFISGLAGALTQKNLEGSSGKNAYLFSMELCVVSVILLLISVLFSEDGNLIRKNGFWNNWTPWTMIPIFTNSVGGIIVGLVTKHAGSVRKGFALIFGIFLSGIIQAPDAGVSREQIVGGALAGISLWVHSAHPPTQELQNKEKRL